MVVIFLTNSVLIDELKGEGSHLLEIWFQCAPEVQLVQQGHSHTWTLSKPDSPRTVHFQLDSDFEWSQFRGQEQPLIAGWYSSRLGDREPSHALRGWRQCMVPKRITSTIMIE